MSEVSESISRERQFARSHGLVPSKTSLHSSRKAWSDATKRPQMARVSGQDVAAAYGHVGRARRGVAAKGGRTIAAPKGGSKPSRTATKDLRRGLARRKATAIKNNTAMNPRRKRITRRG